MRIKKNKFKIMLTYMLVLLMIVSLISPLIVEAETSGSQYGVEKVIIGDFLYRKDVNNKLVLSAPLAVSLNLEKNTKAGEKINLVLPDEILLTRKQGFIGEFKHENQSIGFAEYIPELKKIVFTVSVNGAKALEDTDLTAIFEMQAVENHEGLLVETSGVLPVLRYWQTSIDKGETNVISNLEFLSTAYGKEDKLIAQTKWIQDAEMSKNFGIFENYLVQLIHMNNETQATFETILEVEDLKLSETAILFIDFENQSLFGDLNESIEIYEMSSSNEETGKEVLKKIWPGSESIEVKTTDTGYFISSKELASKKLLVQTKTFIDKDEFEISSSIEGLIDPLNEKGIIPPENTLVSYAIRIPEIETPPNYDEELNDEALEAGTTPIEEETLSDTNNTIESRDSTKPVVENESEKILVPKASVKDEDQVLNEDEEKTVSEESNQGGHEADALEEGIVSEENNKSSQDKLLTESTPLAEKALETLNTNALNGVSQSTNTAVTPMAIVNPAPYTVDTISAGIQMNVFDYWVMKDQSLLPKEEGLATGINKDHRLKFYHSDNYLVNQWTKSAKPRQGIVKPLLGEDGYPVLNEKISGSDESLNYLFNGERIPGAKDAYKGVNHLLQLKDGYYTYDSNKNYAYYEWTQGHGGNFVLSDSYNVYDSGGKVVRVGFFPFNKPNRQNSGNNNLKYGNYYNHLFGFNLNANFTFPENGIYQGKEMVFNFSGDDDTWVFIDGVLVLDIGGIHDASSGSINFATGVVAVQNEENKTLTEIFNAAGKTWDKTPAQEHRLDFFYMERGANQSNLKLEFNLPIIPRKTLEIKKEIQDIHNQMDPNTKYQFKLEINDVKNPSQFNVYKGPASYDDGTAVTFASDGTFTLKAGQTIKVPDLIETQKYKLTEMGLDKAIISSVQFNGKDLTPTFDPNGNTFSVTTDPLLVKENFSIAMKNIVNTQPRTLIVEKKWSDSNTNHEGITFQVNDSYGNPVTLGGSKDFILNAANNWKQELIIPAPIAANSYTVVETVPDGYTATYEKKVLVDGTIQFIIYNQKQSHPGTLKVEKKWYTKDGVEMLNPPTEDVKVQLRRRYTIPAVPGQSAYIADENKNGTKIPVHIKTNLGYWNTYGTVDFTVDKTNEQNENRIYFAVVGAEETPLTDESYMFNDSSIIPIEKTSEKFQQNGKVYTIYSIKLPNPLRGPNIYLVPSSGININSLKIINLKRVKGQAVDPIPEKIIDEMVPNQMVTLNQLSNWEHLWTDLEAASPEGYIYYYYVKEIGVEGYSTSILNNEGIKIDPKTGQTITVKNTSNTRPSVTIHKLDSQTKESLWGAEFEFYKGASISEAKLEKSKQTTNTEGTVVFTDLADGIYWIKEVKAPEGYQLPKESWTGPVEIKGGTVFYGDQDISNKKVDIENDPYVVSLTIYKVDSKDPNKKLQGASFELREKPDGPSVQSITTDENGVGRFADIKNGTYWIVEVNPPQGYKAMTEPIGPFTVENGLVKDSSGKPLPVPELTINNESYLTDVNLKKIDQSTKQPMKDVVFRLMQADPITAEPIIIQEKTTDESGRLTFNDLSDGKYWIEEIKTQPGYKLIDGAVKAFSIYEGKIIDEDGNTLEEIVVENERFQFPATGGDGGRGYLLYGSILMLVALFLQLSRWQVQNNWQSSTDKEGQ